MLLVFHDDDGDWQFLASTEASSDEIVTAHVAHLVDADPTLHEVADLPIGWTARRDNAHTPWQRERTPRDQAEL